MLLLIWLEHFKQFTCHSNKSTTHKLTSLLVNEPLSDIL